MAEMANEAGGMHPTGMHSCSIVGSVAHRSVLPHLLCICFSVSLVCDFSMYPFLSIYL